MHKVLEHKDAVVIFGSCVLFRKNTPVYVEHISHDFTATILNLISQRKSKVPFVFEDFSSPVRRIGFINVDKSVLYGYRLPVRRYKAGIFSDNFKINTLDVAYPLGARQAGDRVKSLQSRELAEALMNKYPTFREACEMVGPGGGYCAVAFDKQFAVDRNERIWYKTNYVGVVDQNKILFSPSYKHLQSLLKDDYAEAI